MELDQDRVRAILEADHSYYSPRPVGTRIDDRFAPSASDLIASQLGPGMRVLDLGCGNGATLLENSHRFASGLGIDNDPAHIDMAREALRQGDCDSVEFRLLDFREDSSELEPESFDFVFSERGPIGYDSYGIQAALRVLKDDGILFCEMIGDLHHQEAAELFGPGIRRNQMIRTLDQARVAMERNGVSIRIASEIVTQSLLSQYLPLAGVPVWHMGLERRLRSRLPTTLGSHCSRSVTRLRRARSRPRTTWYG